MLQAAVQDIHKTPLERARDEQVSCQPFSTHHPLLYTDA